MIFGFCFGIPILLQNVNDNTESSCQITDSLVGNQTSNFSSESSAAYSTQTIYRLSSWPLGLKFLWAPLVDTFYSSRIGRRKTYILPAYLICGMILILISFYIESWISTTSTFTNISMFLSWSVVNICAGTVDIAIDGWALILLGEEHSNLASVSNMSGNAIGLVFGNVLSVLLHVKNVMSISWFIFYCAIAILISAVIVAFSREKQVVAKDLKLKETWSQLWSMFRSDNMLHYVFLVFVGFFPFGAVDGSSKLKLIDLGVCKLFTAYLDLFLFIVAGFVPPFLTKFTYRPARMWRFSFIAKLTTSLMVSTSLGLMFHYRATITMLTAILIFGFVYGIYSCFFLCDHVAVFSMSCKLADHTIGGSSMTFMIGWANLSFGLSAAFGSLLISVFDRISYKIFGYALDGFFYAYLLQLTAGLAAFSVVQHRVFKLDSYLLSQQKKFENDDAEKETLR